MAKLRKNERNAKGKLVFLFISECKVISTRVKVTKKGCNSEAILED